MSSSQEPTDPEPSDQEPTVIRRIKRRPWLDKFDGCMMGCIGTFLCFLGLMGATITDWDHEPEAFPTGSVIFGTGLLMLFAGITIFRLKSK